MSLPSKRDRPRTTGTRGDWDITAQAAPKKAKPPAKARSALKPGKGLGRVARLEHGASGLSRTSRLAPVSDKTKARRADRDAVRKHVCALAHLGGCGGPVDTHEIVRRSQMAEAAYMDDVTIGLCRTPHHDWDLHRLFAEWAGIRIPVEVYKRDPVGSVEEAAHRRSRLGRGFPSWWSSQDISDWHTNRQHYPQIT